MTLDDELVNARVWIGFHFRNSVIAAENLGTSVANWELQRNFLPTNGKDGEPDRTEGRPIRAPPRFVNAARRSWWTRQPGQASGQTTTR